MFHDIPVLGALSEKFLIVVLAVLCVMFLLCLLRLVLGPSVADRLLAVNMLGGIVIAAIGDTLGCGLMLLGAVVFNGFTFPSVKILFLIVFLWMTSPVAAHMVVKLEVLSREKMEDCCPVEAAEEVKACCPSEQAEEIKEGEA